MEFNFRESFQTYSNVELLKIIDQADKYQPEAVEAARNILAGRDVHDSDYEVMKSYKATVTANGRGDQQEELYDYLDAIVKADEDRKVARWVKIVVIILALRYIVMLVYLALPQTPDPGSVYDLFALLPYIYVPFFGLLLYRRKRWGWIGLMAENAMKLTSIIIGAGRYMYYEPELEFLLWYIPGLLIPILYFGGFIFFLGRPRVMAFFNISSHTRRNTIVIGICIALTIFTATTLAALVG
jgi:hypothetical protein